MQARQPATQYLPFDIGRGQPMRTARIPARTTRATITITIVLTLACLGACDRTARQGASVAAAATTTTSVSATPAPSPAASATKAALEIAAENEAASRAAREQTIRVQKHLRDQQRALEAAQSGNGNERCLAGQKMRRVANGWVQAGTC
jgi:hypothetical protein